MVRYNGPGRVSLCYLGGVYCDNHHQRTSADSSSRRPGTNCPINAPLWCVDLRAYGREKDAYLAGAGIDIAYKSITYTAQDRDPDFWVFLFAKLPPGVSRTIELTLARQRFIFTADPENFKAILATQFQDYGKGEPFRKDWHDFLGDSIFTTDGEVWQNSRALIRPQFVKTRISDLEIFEKHVSKLITFMGGRGQEVDVSALFYR